MKRLITPIPSQYREQFSHETYRNNFIRIRAFSYVMVVFVLFTLISYLGMVKVWDRQVFTRFVIADAIFGVVSVFCFVYFNTKRIKPQSIRGIDRFLIYFLAGFLLLWSVIIATNEYSYSSGFPTYIFILFLLSSILYLNFISSFVLIFSSVVVLYLFVYFQFELDALVVQRYFTVLPIAVISFLVSRVLFAAKAENFVNGIEISEMNKHLQHARDNLASEVDKKTRELQYKNKEYKTAKEKAEESDRLKTAFLQNISHEVRTPMNGIIGFADLLNKKEISRDKQQKYLGIIVSNCHHLLTIIENIMTMSSLKAKTEKLLVQRVFLNHVLTETLAIFQQDADEKGIQLHVNPLLSDDQSIIYTDSQKLQQILNNLIGNAIKFTTEGNVTVGYEKNSGGFSFFVKDTGIGFDINEKDKLFIPFWQREKSSTRSYGGTGLGLAIAKSYVELLGGNIWAEQNPDVGSIFWFTLPDMQSEALENLKDTAMKTGKLGNKALGQNYNILIAEDEETNYLYLEEVLSSVGLKTIHSRNGRETIDLFKKNAVDAVLMDVKMPEMDGYQAAEAIKQINPSVPIIAQTAFSNSIDEQRAYNAGCCAFLIKPIDSDELLNVLRKCLGN